MVMITAQLLQRLISFDGRVFYQRLTKISNRFTKTLATNVQSTVFIEVIAIAAAFANIDTAAQTAICHMAPSFLKMNKTATEPKQLPAVNVIAIIPYRLNSCFSKNAFILLSISPRLFLAKVSGVKPRDYDLNHNFIT